MKQRPWHFTAVIILGSILAFPGVGRSAEQDQPGGEVYLKVASQFIKAAEQNDKDAIRAMMTPRCAAFCSGELLSPTIKIISDAGDIQHVEFITSLYDTGTVFVTGSATKFYLNLQLSGNKISGFISHWYKDGESLVVTRPAAEYTAEANALMADINSDNIDAVERLFSPAEQKELPVETEKPFFEKIASDVGQITKATLSGYSVDVATFMLTGERGAESLNLGLDSDSQIAFMEIHSTSSAYSNVVPTNPDDCVNVTRKLTDAVNIQNIESVEAEFAPNVSEQLPADKAAAYFSQVHKSCGAITKVQLTKFYGDEATLELDCEKAKLAMEVSIDNTLRMTWFNLTVSSSATTTTSAQQPAVVLPELHLKRLGETK